MSRPMTPASAAPISMLDGARPMSYAPSEKAGFDAGNESAVYDAPPVGQSVAGRDDKSVNETPVGVQRSASQMSQSQTATPSRGGTLKKRSSIKRTVSLKRSASHRSSYAGSVRSLRLGDKEKYEPTEESNSAFYSPIPITGNPTELLADRFQAWRKVLKDLISYFRDLQKSYENRSKALLSTSNVINNTALPPNFMTSGGLADATYILRDFHKLSMAEASKSKELENEVILQLTGLRSDLQQKIKEIKSLSGDFKNSVSKEQDNTRKAVRSFQDALGGVDHDAAATAGKGDPFLVKMGVDRQLEKQIEEENYLHRAYLNLETSGRELESIVVGEIQKAYSVLAGILKREGDQCYEFSEKMREGPLAMPKDQEWENFVSNNDHMVDPRIPLRTVEQITYPGKDHPAAIEVKSGMLERKSKYLKNYTPGWYVLSPTHLHEFKSADKIAFQAPIMSLYLPEQKLGTHSEAGSSSNKFMLKGRQTGNMHRGHSWIFRAESHDTMLAWYEDIKELTEKRGEARNEFVRRNHARTMSSGSMKAPSINSTGSAMEDDEADQVAFSGEQSVRGQSLSGPDAAVAGIGAAGVGALGAGTAAYIADDGRSEAGWRPPQRPTPGGRFPSDLNVQRGLASMPLSPSSQDSVDDRDRELLAAAGALPGSGIPFVGGLQQPHTDLQTQMPATQTVPTTTAMAAPPPTVGYTAGQHPNVLPTGQGALPNDASSAYGEWMSPMNGVASGAAHGIGSGVSAGAHGVGSGISTGGAAVFAAAGAAGGAVLGAGGAHLYDKQKQPQAENVEDQMSQPSAAIPAAGESSAPIMAATAVPTVDTTDSRPTTESTATTAATNGTGLSTAPTSVVGEAAAPSQTLASHGISTGREGVLDTQLDESEINLMRPTPVSTKSVQTISDLHVPGEFPKGSIDATNATSPNDAATRL